MRDDGSDADARGRVVRVAAGLRAHPGVRPQANRKLAIMSEGEGRLTSGQRFYYIAYLTDEGLPAQEPLRSHALWGEMQSLWKKRRAALDATQYELVFIDARVFPGTPGSRTLRTVYEAKDGYWSGEEVASFVIEETDLP
jgi:hypothetical protein